MVKRCSRCNKIKSFLYFGIRNKGTGLRFECDDCRNFYYIKNKNVIKNKSKIRYVLKKPEILEKSKKYRQKTKTKRNAFERQKRKENPEWGLVGALRNRLNESLQTKQWKKTTRFSEYIGCNREELIQHLENQFLEGMSWENRSEWHIDHIKPLSLASDIDDLYRRCHYTNLRPLWAKENLIKGARF